MCDDYVPIIKRRNNITSWPKKMDEEHYSEDSEGISHDDGTRDDEDSEDITPNDHHTTPKIKTPTKNGRNISSIFKENILICGIVVTAIFGGFAAYYFKNCTSGNNVTTDDTNLEEMLMESRSLFPKQHNETWLSFIFAVNTTLNLEKPAVFLLLHSDSVIAECFVSHVSRKVQKVFKSEEPLKLSALDEIKMFDNDKKEVTKYRSEVEKRIVVEVHDFEKFPGEIAKHFHSFCDVYNPMVKKAVYFFIMKTNDKGSNQHSRARNTMVNLWNKSLSDNELDPLIIRLSENVIDILPESDLSHC